MAANRPNDDVQISLSAEDTIAEIRGTVTIGSELSEVGRARRWIAELAEQAALSPKLSYDLQLVLSEACTNAIKHSYALQPGHDVELSATIDEQRVCMVIRDYGKRINLDAYQEPDLDNAHEGGYGVYIMRQLMDEVRFDVSHETGNELWLLKNR